MKHHIYKTCVVVTFFLVNINSSFSQANVAEKDLIGNWKITGGSGNDFDKEMIGVVFTFETDSKISRIDEGEKLQSEWKIEENVITITSHYNDGINNPDIEKLSIIGFKAQKLTANYSNDEDEKFIIVLERINTP